MYVIAVVPISKSTHREVLSYFYKEEIPRGTLVTIPYRKKDITGLVVGSTDAILSKDALKNASFELRKIKKVKGPAYFSYKFLEAVSKLARYYVTTENRILDILIPELFLKEYLSLATPKNSILASGNYENEKLIFQAPEIDRLAWYKTYIRESFARKESVLICLPTIHDIETFGNAIGKGIESYTVLLHSDLPKKTRIGAYNKLMNDEHPLIIIATPTYAVIPRNDIGTVIIEHERSTVYKTIIPPGIDLRIFLELWATVSKRRLILGDTLLRLETYHRLSAHEVSEVRTPVFKLTEETPIQIVEIVNEKHKRNFESITEPVEKMIREKAQHAHVFLFTLRNGLATITRCKDCTAVLSCEFCNSPLVLYPVSGSGRVFICNVCKRHTPSDSNCKNCGSWNLVTLGIGIDLVFNECKEKFPDIPLFRIDRETVKDYKKGLRVIKDFMDSSNGILVGTELATSFLKEKVSTAIVISFDSLFHIPSFRITERIISLILELMQVSRNELVIQTRNATDPLLTAISRNNLISYLKEELEERKKYVYPPFGTLIKLQTEGSREALEKESESIREIFKDYTVDVFKSARTTKDAKQILNIVLRLPKGLWSLPEITGNGNLTEGLRIILESLKNAYRIYIDPEDLLS